MTEESCRYELFSTAWKRQSDMSYTVQQIKVFAYNRTEKPDFTVAERDLFLCLAYVYEWYRANPDDKDACEQLAKKYIEHFETDYQNSQVMNSVPLNRQN